MTTPAFPTPHMEGFPGDDGMSLRDWFAGRALSGLVMDGWGTQQEVAEEAYRIAGAMLEARKKETDR